jgi:iron complex outermembrane receptor protein
MTPVKICTFRKFALPGGAMGINDKGLFIIFLTLCGVISAYAQNDNIKMSLIPDADSVISLGEVNVTAYRVNTRLHSTPGSISVLSGSEINISDGTGLASVLNTLPGVNMQTGTFTTSRIVIRGMGSRTPYNTNRIRAYLNDIPLTAADGVSTPEEIDLSGLGKIEVLKGPSSALYGSGLGGSINLYTPEKTDNEGNVELQYGSFNTIKANLSGNISKGNTYLWGSAGRLHSDGYRENSRYDRTTIVTTGDIKMTEWSVKTTLLLINVNGEIPSSLGETQFLAHPEEAAQNWKAAGGYKKYLKGLAAVTLTNELSDNLTNQFAVFGKWNDNFEKRPFNNLDDLSQSGGFRNKLTWNTPKSDWIIGAEWISEQYKWRLDNANIQINENRENRNQLNLFAMLYYKPLPGLNISLAGALNRISYRLNDLFPANGDQAGKRVFPLIISPRIGINYAPNNIVAVYGSAGHGFSLPSPEETLLPEGDINTGIKPEQGMQYEIGARLNLFDRAVEADASIYRIELNNLLVTRRITEDVFTGMNAGKTRHQGFELLLRSRFFDFSRFPGRLTSSVSYTHSLNRFIDFTDSGISYDGNRLPGIPDQSLQLRINWNLIKNTELLFDLHYSGFQYLNDSNTLNYPGYFLSNIKLTTKINLRKTWPVFVHAGINNIADAHYASMLIVNAIGFNNSEPRYYYPGLPRHFYAGIKYRF